MATIKVHADDYNQSGNNSFSWSSVHLTRSHGRSKVDRAADIAELTFACERNVKRIGKAVKLLALHLAAALAIVMPTKAYAARIDFTCVFTAGPSREVLQLVLDEKAAAAVVVTPGQDDFVVEAATFSPNQVTFKHNKYTWLLSRLSLELLRLPTNSEDENLIERGNCQRIWKRF